MTKWLSNQEGVKERRVVAKTKQNIIAALYLPSMHNNGHRNVVVLFCTEG
jgi:hypothetical protein